MPDFSTALGTISPDYGIEGLATFKGVNDPIQARGHVPAPPAGTSADSVLRADATWGAGGGTAASLVPAMAFTGSVAGGTGQIFTNPLLNQYALAQDVQLFVNRTTKLIGLPLGADFNLDNVNGQIRVLFSLPASASLFIDSKTLPKVITTVSYYLNEDGIDRFLTEDNNDLLILEM